MLHKERKRVIPDLEWVEEWRMKKPNEVGKEDEGKNGKVKENGGGGRGGGEEEMGWSRYEKLGIKIGSLSLIKQSSFFILLSRFLTLLTHLPFHWVICSLPLEMKFLVSIPSFCCSHQLMETFFLIWMTCDGYKIIFAAIIAISQATLHKQIIIKKIIRLPSYHPVAYAAPEPVKLIKTYPTAGDRYFVPKPEPIYVTKTVSYPAPAYEQHAPLYSEPAPLPAYPAEPAYAAPAYSAPAYPSEPAYAPAYAPAPRKVIHIIEAPTVAYPAQPAYSAEPAYPSGHAAYPAEQTYAEPAAYSQPALVLAYPEPSLSYDEYKKK